MTRFQILYSFDGKIIYFDSIYVRLYRSVVIMANSKYDALIRFFRNEVHSNRIVESIREI